MYDRQSRFAKQSLMVLLSLVLAVGGLLAGFPQGRSYAQTPDFHPVRQDEFPVAPGAYHKEMTLEGGIYVEEVKVMEIDPSQPFLELAVTSPKGKVVSLDTVRNQAKLAESEGRRAVAAFNMDFYNTDPNFAGIPTGHQISAGEVITAPSTRRNVLAQMKDGTVRIETEVELAASVKAEDGETAVISGVNRAVTAALSNHLFVFTDRFSSTTKSVGEQIVEVIIAPDPAGSVLQPGIPLSGTVEAVVEGGNQPIPGGKLVVTATGSKAEWARRKLTPGSRVELDVQFTKGMNEALQLVSGSVLLVRNGQATPEALADKDRHPRTFVAVKQGKLYVYTFDGRQPGYSDGVTLAEGALFLQEEGMEFALNVDGGGSTTYAARLPGDQSLSVLNRPSDGYERSNSNSLVVLSTAPVKELSTLLPAPKGPVKVIAGGSISFTSKGQDEFYNGIPVDSSQLTWEADAAIGTIDSLGRFTAAATPAEGQVTVRLGEISAQVNIQVVTQVERIELIPSIAVINPGDKQSFRVRGYDANGQEVILSPDRLNWSMEGNLGTLSPSGELTAGNESASGKVIVSIGQASAEAVVHIGKPPVLVEDFEALDDLVPSLVNAVPGSVKLELSSRPNPVRVGAHAVKLTYDFTGTSGTSAAYINFRENGAAGRTLEDYPIKLGLWVYGDGNKHWLRGQIQDGNGTKKPIDFTGSGQLNWVGWKYVTADIPAGMPLPLKLTQIYVVETSNANKNAGAIYFDHLRSIYSETGEDLEGPVFSDRTPEPGSQISTGTPIIAATVKDAGTGVDRGSIVMRLDGTVVAHEFDEAGGRVSYTPVEALKDGEHRVVIEAADLAGNPAVPNADWTFSIDTAPDREAPTVSVISPMDGIRTRTDQPRIAVKLTDDKSGIDSGSITLELDGTAVPHRYDEASSTVYYTVPDKLQQGTTHRVRLSAADMSGNRAEQEWSFTIGRLPGQPNDPNRFQISVIGDGGYYTAGQGETAADILLREQIARINREDSELVGYTGDIVENDTPENYAIAIENMNLFRMPYLVSIGNHEISGTGSRVNYQSTFGDTTYLYDFGNTRIIGLDTASGMISNSDASQWPWLEETLADTEQNNIIIIMHVPPDEITADGENLNTGHGFQNSEEAGRLYDLLGTYKAAHPSKNLIVFSGDLHAYLHKQVQGVHYIVSGGGGKYTHISPDKGGFYHYLNVHVEDDSLSWDVIPLLERIDFVQAPDTIQRGETVTLRADGHFMTSTNQPITMPVQSPFKVEWETSDPQVASVDSEGRVTGHSTGEAVITVKSGWAKAEKTLRVSGGEPIGLELTGLEPLEAGDTAQAEVWQLLSDGSRVKLSGDVRFHSSNDLVAEVSDDGLVSAWQAGEAVITAEYGTWSATYTLIVSPYTGVPLQEKVMAVDAAAGAIELEFAGAMPLTETFKVFQTGQGQPAERTLNDVRVGAENVTAFINRSGAVYKLLIEGETPPGRMRVGIRTDIGNIADLTTLNHSRIELVAKEGFRLEDKIAGVTFDIAANSPAALTVSGGQTVVHYGGAELYRTANRLYAHPAGEDSRIQVSSIRRSQGQPQYRGTLEMTLTPAKDALRLINDIDLERYLYQVVPSEMPASFGLEALKAQAVAARTYALTDYYNSRFADRGFHIDDSTLSQVYNNSAENGLTTQAVNETAGIVMKSGNELVDARFYSTSGGYGASRHEVWADAPPSNAFPGTPAPYLTAQSYTYDPSDPGEMLRIDTANERQINEFYKTLSHTGYDSDSLYFRWKVGLTRQELENTINRNLPDRYAADPLFILTMQPDGSFASQPIPPGGIGSLRNMYVAKRGAGGNIMELVVEGSSGTYKIVKEFNIRFTIRPSQAYTGGGDIFAYRAKGGSADYDPAATLRNPSILYSAFFTFDLERDGQGDIVRITFYGGGNGHGVGMSQYGASLLGGRGWSYDRILTTYYPNMNLVPIYGPSRQLESIELSGPDSLVAGETGQTEVTAYYSDGTMEVITEGVNYASSHPEVAAVDESGLVTALRPGQTVIAAEYEGQTVSYRLTVTLSLNKLEISGLGSMRPGEQSQTVVMAVYGDGSRHPVMTGVTFSSSRPEVASINETGLVTALRPGQTVISAVYAGQTAGYNLTVISPEPETRLEIIGLSAMNAGEKRQIEAKLIHADGSSETVSKGVQWTSSDPQIAKIDSKGRITALKPGVATIRAQYREWVAEAELVVRVQLQKLDIGKLKPMKEGETFQIVVTAIYSDGTRETVTADSAFTSSDPDTATVDNGGLIRALHKGNTTITVEYGGLQVTEKLNVTKAPPGRNK
ncbi:SpoIID/LytB domain-containing protein [Paenibacillus residui]|uniref:SpoIID/LytB domain-containing protein n=1 Tax=Paenibacillus residui TaxID=629724 RepID=A0ABW3D9A8_9BACL